MLLINILVIDPKALAIRPLTLSSPPPKSKSFNSSPHPTIEPPPHQSYPSPLACLLSSHHQIPHHYNNILHLTTWPNKPLPNQKGIVSEEKFLRVEEEDLHHISLPPHTTIRNSKEEDLHLACKPWYSIILNSSKELNRTLGVDVRRKMV